MFRGIPDKAAKGSQAGSERELSSSFLSSFQPATQCDAMTGTSAATLDDEVTLRTEVTYQDSHQEVTLYQSWTAHLLHEKEMHFSLLSCCCSVSSAPGS